MEGSLEKKPKGTFESTYGRVLTGFMVAANPFKKIAFKTPCMVHRYINIQAVQILDNEGHTQAAHFYKAFIKQMNEGAVWADQDFKSINHFYHNKMHKGLYGFSDALSEARKYRDKSLFFLEKGNVYRSVFYLGVVAHLIQDMTVPQHVNNRLLDSHKSYETWIKEKIFAEIDYSVHEGVERFDHFDDYIRENAKTANILYEKYSGDADKEKVYYDLSTQLIAEAQRTTAGLLLDFYEEHYSGI